MGSKLRGLYCRSMEDRWDLLFFEAFHFSQLDTVSLTLYMLATPSDPVVVTIIFFSKKNLKRKD